MENEKAIILVGHGTIAQGFIDAVTMIAGKQEYLYSVSLNAEESSVDLLDALSNLHPEKFSEVCVFIDLLGGSPSQVILQNFKDNANIKVVTGMNFPMILNTVLTRNFDLDNIIEIGRDGIVNMKQLLKTNQNDVDW